MNGRRSLLALALLLLAQLILLTSQVRDPEGEQTALERWSLRALAPFARAVAGGRNAVSSLGEGLRSRGDLQEENRDLRRRVEELDLERARLHDLEQQVERLSSALGYRAPFEGQTRLADVVYIDHASSLRTLLFYLPGRPAVKDSPVTARDGLVGRVILSQGEYAKVQLLTDRASGVGAMIERTRRQGIARGAGPDGLSLEYIPLQADVEVGDLVVTAGTDGLYPRGIPVARVVAVEPGPELFHRIRLAPAVDFGLLDQVFVLLADSMPGRVRGATSASP